MNEYMMKCTQNVMINFFTVHLSIVVANTPESPMNLPIHFSISQTVK